MGTVAVHAEKDPDRIAIINGNADSVEAEEILQWQQVRGFEADLLVLDNGRVVMDQYIDANPGQNFTQSVSVIFDQEMRIRDLDGTYVEDDDSDLQLLIDLASQ